MPTATVPEIALIFRTAEREDAEVLLGLYASLESETARPPTPRQIDRFFARLDRYPDYRVHLVEAETEDGGIVTVGCYSLVIIDNLAHGATPLALVESVVVTPAWRGRGIGRMMMEHARAQARAAGCYKLMLSSNLRRTDAHRFYDGLGFERHGYSFQVTP